MLSIQKHIILLTDIFLWSCVSVQAIETRGGLCKRRTARRSLSRQGQLDYVREPVHGGE